jgi:hypothetical protein
MACRRACSLCGWCDRTGIMGENGVAFQVSRSGFAPVSPREYACQTGDLLEGGSEHQGRATPSSRVEPKFAAGVETMQPSVTISNVARRHGTSDSLPLRFEAVAERRRQRSRTHRRLTCRVWTGLLGARRGFANEDACRAGKPLMLRFPTRGATSCGQERRSRFRTLRLGAIPR